MHPTDALPRPDAAALAHSERVCAAVRRRIDERGGWLDFAEYMDAVLYAPGLGYYSAGAAKFGAAGDFVTAPGISDLFGRSLARAIAPVVARGGEQCVLEVGAGTGALAADVLRALERAGVMPRRYRILEVSAELRQRQRDTIAERVPELLPRVEWLDVPPAGFDGVILANEVADALPVSRFVIAAGDDRVHALGVARDGDGFCWSARAAGEALRQQVVALERSTGTTLPAGYRSELCPGLPGFIGTLAAALRDGACLLIDYGLPRRELYATARADGTLICHYRHRAHDDPFLYPGLQDVSAWVDFSAVAEAAVRAGLRVDGYMTQAAFLMAAGIEDEFLAAEADGSGDPQTRPALSRQMQTLLMPGEMGEKFKVMWLGKGEAAPTPEFAQYDQRHRL